ncbi:kinase-like domain-containing protein [Rhizophagus clarus]|uniref:Kinase-like domain-containing protein n=1 Tax=Rhizophagus clarus TaxID=94130 RepID=A0A8H3QT98_9GLOM|nr:kinase-like domain-containing protein [Rhizophagus clarus]
MPKEINNIKFTDSDDESDSDDENVIIKPFLLLEEGIKAHNEEKYDIAINVSENLDDAIKLYKEAAEDDVTEASFQYAMCILKHQEYFNKEDCEKHLRKAADRKHIDAQFYLAELYIHGKFGIERKFGRNKIFEISCTRESF